MQGQIVEYKSGETDQDEMFLNVSRAIDILDQVILKSVELDGDVKDQYRVLRMYIRQSRDSSVKTGLDLYKAITQFGLFKDGDRFAIDLLDTSPKLDDKHKYTGLIWIECCDKYVQGPALSFVPGSGLGNVFAGANPRYWNAILCGAVKEIRRKG